MPILLDYGKESKLFQMRIVALATLPVLIASIFAVVLSTASMRAAQSFEKKVVLVNSPDSKMYEGLVDTIPGELANFGALASLFCLLFLIIFKRARPILFLLVIPYGVIWFIATILVASNSFCAFP